MGSDDSASVTFAARVVERVVAGARWVFAVLQGFSWSRHLDQPDHPDT